MLNFGGQQGIVGVEKLNPIAGGEGKEFIAGGVTAAIGAAPYSGAIGKFGEALGGIVGGAIVDHNDLAVGVRLLQARLHGGLDPLGGIVGRNQNADF